MMKITTARGLQKVGFCSGHKKSGRNKRVVVWRGFTVHDTLMHLMIVESKSKECELCLVCLLPNRNELPVKNKTIHESSNVAGARSVERKEK